MEWILILTLVTGTVTMPRPFASEQECIGAGETALPRCVEADGLFGEIRETCFRARYVCVPQPRIVVRRKATCCAREIR